MTTIDQPAIATVHPLEPLGPEELRTAATILKAAEEVPASVRFGSINLREPDKDSLAAFAQAGVRPPREAFAVMVDRSAGTLMEGVVDLDAARILIADQSSPGWSAWTSRPARSNISAAAS
jgi:primary-amine oxidase